MASDSHVLDAFIRAVAGADPDRAEPVQREAERVVDAADDRRIVERALTAASRSASLACGEEPRTTLIRSGDDAFKESFRFRPATDRPRPEQRVVEALKHALDLAGDQLGPFRGGERGAFKAPGQAPQVVKEITPSQQRLVEMARAAGAVVGLASTTSAIDSLAEVRSVIDGYDNEGPIPV